MQKVRIRKRIHLAKIMLAALICAACVINGIYALASSEYTFINGIATGSVKVSIEQLKMQDGNLINSEDVSEVVYSGQSVSYIPRVNSERAPGYIRIAGSLNIPGKDPIPLTKSNVTTSSAAGLGEGWIERGGYFYLTVPLSDGQTSDPFTELIIPAEAADAKGQSLVVNVSADIIQSDNVTPDFDSEAPWGQVTIETARADDTISYGIANTKEKLNGTLVYTRSKTFESTAEDLFAGTKYHMAGDSYSDTLNIKNASGNDIKLYFRTQNTDTDLLEQMQLKISYDNKPVYEGSLLSEPLGQYKELAVLGKSKTGKFDFEVSLPLEAANTVDGNRGEETRWIEASQDEVIWQFKAVEIPNSFQTGQNIPGFIAVLFIIALLSGLYAAVEFRKFRKENDIEEQ